MRLKHVLRRLIHSPGFTVITALTLALGIGANCAIFAVIEGVLLKPLPYPDADRLIGVNHTAPGINFQDAGISPSFYFTYRDEAQSLDAVGLWRARAASVTGLTEPEEVRVIDVTAEVLPVLRVRPVLGRWFSEKDDSPGAPETVILSYGYWEARFGGDPAVLGRRIVVDGVARDIVGVMPQSFRFLTEQVSLLRPLQFDRSKTLLGDFSYRGIARLKAGMTATEVRTDIARLIPLAIEKFPVAQGYSKQMHIDAHFAANVKPLKDEVVGDVGKTLWVLLGTIGVVLLIACANVANLLLVRAEGREQELAIRAALGASRTQIARELLGESIALALLGGVLGLGIAYGGVRVLVATAPANFPRLDEISIDPLVLAFAFGVSLLAGLLFGAIPASKYTGPRLAFTMRAGGRALSSSRERRLTRDTLAIMQMALALVLLVGSGLMIRTFQELRRVEPGFDKPSEVLTLHIYIPETQAADGDAVLRMEQNILDKLNAVAGVKATGIANLIPMTLRGPIDPIWAQDQPDIAQRVPKLRRFKFVSPGFLQAMGTPLVAGRGFTWVDTRDRRPVALVSENLAREFWGSASNAIGKQIHENPATPWREVIGVVHDEHEDGVDHDAPQIAYWPLLMNDFRRTHDLPQRSVMYVVRSLRTGTQAFLEEVQRAIWSVNPNLPVAGVQTLEDIYTKSLARTSFTLVMLVIAGGMALLIGLVGIYGVVSYSVSQRRREIGIRLALGASNVTVMFIFLLHALMLAAIGVGSGILAALAMSRLLSSLLFHVTALDPAIYSIVVLVLFVTTALASYIPVRRATRVDPLSALRAE